ncbi:MAG: hypothetical protein U9P12_04110, partial [Verrucomicrobiota bacterium]|nr:hypothetical protein [Verrucomicrobiota bacterium]
DGIGLYMSGGNNSYWTTTSTQTYQFVVQALDSNVPTQTVLNATFQLSGDKVADGQWLYIDTDNVALQNGQWYGFSLGPVETAVNGVLRTFWNTASGDVYVGLARQYAPNSSTFFVPKEDTYTTGGSPQGDYTFYMLREPPPIIISIVDWSFVSEDLVKMVVDIPGNPALYHPETTTNLALGPWTSVAQSIDGGDPFVITNLGYSAVGSNGTDRITYLKAEGNPAFFHVAAGASPPPASWIFAGNEMEEIVDAETGRTVIYLTRGDSLDTHFHYHGGSWGTINGATYLFFASSRERPAGVGTTLSGERQLMAANVETGDLYYLTSIPNPLEGRLYYHRPYQATYNDDLKTIFFWGLLRHQLYAYNCVTGVRTLLVTLPSTHVSRLMDDFVDATSVRLIYPVSDRATDLEYIEVADFDRDLNPLSRTVVRTSLVGDALNHVEIRPDDKDVFFYKHHQNVDSPSYQAILMVADLSSQQSDIVVNSNETPYVDHMIWGKSGDHIYWDDNAGNLWSFDWAAQTNAIVGGASPIHNQLSSDEQLWVYDRRTDPPYFSQPFEHITLENWQGSIRIHDMATDTSEKQANIIWASPHPRHPHAIFSPDDSMISFVTGMDNENSRVAIMRVVE